MNTRSLLNIFLLILVLGLIWLISHKQQQNAEQIHLSQLQREQIKRIVIPRSKGDIVIEKHGEFWRMQSPYQIRAHQFRIDRLLDLATSTVDKRYDFDPASAQQYGLADNNTRIGFNDITIEFGNKNPLNNKRYAKVGQQLYLINDELYPLINSQPSSFADLQVIQSDQHISSIDIDQQFNVFKAESGGWQSDNEPRPSADSLQTFIDNWQRAQAFGVHAYLPRKQLGKIHIILQDKSVIELEITDTQPWLILGRPALGIEYHFDKQFNQRLLTLPTTDSATDSNDA